MKTGEPRRYPKIEDDASKQEILARYPNARINIIEKRRARGLTREQLAKLMDVTRYTIYNIEMGRYDPSLRVMERWTEALHEDSLDIFRSNPYHKRSQRRIQPLTDAA